MAVMEITVSNFEETLKTSKPVLMDLWAPWCPSCVQLGPELEAAEKELSDKVVIGKANVDNSKELAVKFGVMSIPTMIIFKDGKEVDRHVGYMEAKSVVDFISKHI